MKRSGLARILKLSVFEHMVYFLLFDCECLFQSHLLKIQQTHTLDLSGQESFV